MEECKSKVIDDFLVIELNEELDHHNAELIRDEIDKQIEIEDKKYVVFDFNNVSFMDSSGIGVIMGRYRKVYYMGGRIYVVGINKILDRIFSMSGLYKIVTKCDSLDDVLHIDMRTC